MQLLFGALLTFTLATVIGLGGTWMTMTRGTAFGAVAIGAWTSWPKTGTTDIDPYARASIARSGELPIGLGDGVAFFARVDDKGFPLDGRCEVVVSGTTPQARYWTMSLYDSDGFLVPNALNRFGFTSQEITRRSDGGMEVVIAPRARPGNWLPTGGIDRYVVVLRLYDTPVGVSTRASQETPMPSIVQKACS